MEVNQRHPAHIKEYSPMLVGQSLQSFAGRWSFLNLTDRAWKKIRHLVFRDRHYPLPSLHRNGGSLSQNVWQVLSCEIDSPEQVERPADFFRGEISPSKPAGRTYPIKTS